MKLPKNLDAVCRDACAVWSPRVQEDVAIGELGELLALFGKRAQNRATTEQWVDEIADGIIMLHQLATIHGLDAVEDRIAAKTPVLAARIQASMAAERALAERFKAAVLANPRAGAGACQVGTER